LRQADAALLRGCSTTCGRDMITVNQNTVSLIELRLVGDLRLVNFLCCCDILCWPAGILSLVRSVTKRQEIVRAAY